MSRQSLKCQVRSVVGHPVRKLRKQNILPAVVYGKSFESKNIQLELSNFLHIYKLAGKTNVIDLEMDDATTQPSIVHKIDVDPVKETVLHVDFLAVDLSTKIETSVPIKFVGIAPAVKELGGILLTNLDTLDVNALPDKIPDFIEIDVSKMNSLDSVIHVSDINIEGIDVLNDQEETVATIGLMEEEPETTEEVAISTESTEPTAAEGSK